MVVDALPKPREESRRRRIRDFLRDLWAKANETLDGTGSFRRRSTDFQEPPDNDLRFTPQKVQLPQWLFAFMFAQLMGAGGAIWWAATLQSDVRYLQTENAKLWQKMEMLDLQRQTADARFDEKVRAKVRETMEDAGYIRVRDKGD